MKLDQPLPKLVIDISDAVKAAGGRAILVGGFVRDRLLAKEGFSVIPKDPDLEIYHIEPEKLKEILCKFGEVNEVGAAFSVFKVADIDVSIPRRDSKVSKGHRGFVVDGDPNMTFTEAAKRRDFTVNAVGQDPISGDLLDEYGGIEDIGKKVLRAVDPNSFGEDPLRVLRAMQFAGRYNFSIDPKTVEICRKLPLLELSKERVGEEWRKLLLMSPKPSIGLEAARELGIVKKLHPELAALIDTPQNPRWHPEGDVWVHTLCVVDQAAKIIRREKLDQGQSLVIMLAALTHDFGKPKTTQEKNGKIVSYGHAEAGYEPAKRFMKDLCVNEDLIEKVLLINCEHMFQVFNDQISDTSVRKLSNRLKPANIQELVWLIEADWHGRGIEHEDFPSVEALLKKAQKLHIAESAPKPLVRGRDLIKFGLKPGPEFGPILSSLFEAQLEGKFSSLEEGVQYYKKYIA